MWSAGLHHDRMLRRLLLLHRRQNIPDDIELVMRLELFKASILASRYKTTICAKGLVSPGVNLGGGWRRQRVRSTEYLDSGSQVLKLLLSMEAEEMSLTK
jgi:hypothetical protein